MLWFTPARDRRSVLRGTLGGALACVVLVPVACATASSSAQRPSASPTPSSAISESATAPVSRAKPITVKVGPKFFGVHDASTDMASLTKAGVGSIRLWDSGVKWWQVEPNQDQFDWTRLDQYVKLAHAHNTEVTLVLAGTPAWAAADPAHTTYLDPPNVDAYKAYLTAVMNRYKAFDPDNTGQPYRGIANYQVWNEPNIKTFWTGTPQQMADLVRAAWEVRQAVDPGAKIIAPSMVTRLTYEVKWIKSFYQLSTGGKKVWRYIDAMTYSFYPVDKLPNGQLAGPEDMMTLVKTVKAALAQVGVPRTIPVWNSEVNYGLLTGSQAHDPTPAIPASLQAAYVLRTYLLSAAAGVPRVFWYRYDIQNPLVNTFMTDSTGALTPAGNAFYLVQRWLKGTLVGTATQRPCPHDKNGTYTCVVRYATGMGRIYWNPHKTVRVRTVTSTRSWQTTGGTTKKVSGSVRLRVGYGPILVKSKH